MPEQKLTIRNTLDAQEYQIIGRLLRKSKELSVEQVEIVDEFLEFPLSFFCVRWYSRDQRLSTLDARLTTQDMVLDEEKEALVLREPQLVKAVADILEGEPFTKDYEIERLYKRFKLQHKPTSLGYNLTVGGGPLREGVTFSTLPEYRRINSSHLRTDTENAIFFLEAVANKLLEGFPDTYVLETYRPSDRYPIRRSK